MSQQKSMDPNIKTMKKIIIQIPCFNEEDTLPTTLNALPRTINGEHPVEWLIIDDGSTDNTSEVAKSLGVDHIVTHYQNLGLARAFMTGIDACLERGADIIVNTDADNQYCADCIPDLVNPVLQDEAHIVIGARPIQEIAHFSVVKKFLQRLGTWGVGLASGTKILDAPSGFRAFSRQAAMQINVFSNYSYTLETIIQAGQRGLTVKSVPIKTNEFLRPSRLLKSIPSYIWKQVLTIIRIFMTYRSFRFFALPGIDFIFDRFFIRSTVFNLLFEWFRRRPHSITIIVRFVNGIGLFFGYIRINCRPHLSESEITGKNNL